MAQKPKIEFYKFRIRKKSDNSIVEFRTLFREKFNLHGQQLDLNGFFSEYTKYLIRELDSDGYYLDNRRKKGYTIDVIEDSNGEKKSQIKLNSEEWTVSGILDGGKHGIKRTLGLISDKENKTPINMNNIVCDKFYFLLYTPINNSEGIIMIQGYTELKISDIFRDHIRKLFSHRKDLKCEIEVYIPESLKKKYLQSATFNSATFSTGWVVSPDFDDLESKTYELQVNIQIIDKSKEKLNYTETNRFVSLFGNSILKMGNQKSKEKQLKAFQKKSAKINTNGKTIPIKFDKDHIITPVIHLEDEGIVINPETGELNFEELHDYCLDLLNQINEEFLPQNAIQDL